MPVRSDILAARLMNHITGSVQDGSPPQVSSDVRTSLPNPHRTSPLMMPRPNPRIHLPLLGEKGTPDSRLSEVKVISCPISRPHA